MTTRTIIVWVCLLAVCYGQRAEHLLAQNPCSSKTTCSDCARTATCAWCFAPEFNGPRCFNPAMEGGTAGCDEAYIFNPDNQQSIDPMYNRELTRAKGRMGIGMESGYYEESMSSSSSSSSGSSVKGGGGYMAAGAGENLVQIKPQRVKLQLRMNQMQKMSFSYAQAQDYPVDLYYLMDLSRSMKNDKEKLSTLGSLLSSTMRNITSNFRIGFGSFVDKLVMPYVSTVPKNLISPCDGCAAPYGYKNQMSLSNDTDFFDKAVAQADVSGNLDAPEGGFDAIMQAVVCKQEIGWREHARKLLVFSTDAGFHYAGDGKLGGIVQPNDGECHMEDNSYTHSTVQDYPSISQINLKVKEHAINVIFAVTAEQINVYEQLSRHIEGSSSGILSDDSDNVVDLVREQYNKITSTVEMKDTSSDAVQIMYYSSCLGSKDKLVQTNKCEGLKIPRLPPDLYEQSIPAVNSDLEESRATLNDQPTTLSVDDQFSMTVSNELPSTSTQEDDNSQLYQDLSSTATVSQQAISSTPKNKKSACLFCDHVEKKVGKRRIYVTFPQSEATVETIKSMAAKLNDSKLLTKLENPQSVAYHSNCFSLYQMSLKQQCKEHSEPRYWHKNRQFHQSAFSAISEIIMAEIIEKNRIMYFTDLLSQYKSLLLEFSEGQVRAEDLQEYRAENLENKIIKALGDRVTIESSLGPTKRKIVYQYDMDSSRLALEIAKLQSTEKNRCRDVAYELRNCITSQERMKLPVNLTPEDVILGECNIPEQLFNFVCDLVQGPDTRRKNSDDDLVKIKSVCSDLIYIVTKGRVKPSKHLTLGLSMKSMTSSRKVLTILNRYGHTIGYNLAEEIETEMTYSSQKENNVIPAGISRVDGLSTHVAFDNFDRFVDTATGKDTLHDTVGIIYQFRSENDDPNNMDSSDTSDSESLGAYVHEGPTEPLARVRKRRRFEAPSKEIRPFVKTPFTSMTFLPFQTITEIIDACHSGKLIAIDKDLIWSMSLSRIDSVPMWLGYNCKISIDGSKIQKVEYLSPINESPTSLAVVQETLNIAKEVAKNCNQQQIIATYDLAIAKLACRFNILKNQNLTF
ncbi:unnamed protein product [Pieris macdunnoughi]|uniref:Integrin beta n=1 Tax=Pieris macdunnoughi TaxID=345717 RepID=A0A821MVJ6_9NEOP|nr:unnamed protein product [Pieris macdunnoughi]